MQHDMVKITEIRLELKIFIENNITIKTVYGEIYFMIFVDPSGA